jgi:ATP-dependent Clp protease ATP-binding subunit ClpA
MFKVRFFFYFCRTFWGSICSKPHTFSVRVTRETAPEGIDKLQRRKLELEVEIHALEREKDRASKDRLQAARKTIAQVDDELVPLVTAHENKKSRGDEVNSLRKKIDELKAKADEAERR